MPTSVLASNPTPERVRRSRLYTRRHRGATPGGRGPKVASLAVLAVTGLAALAGFSGAVARAQTPRIAWPSGPDGSFAKGDELRAVYLFDLFRADEDPIAAPGDLVQIQAVFSDIAVDVESFFKGEAIPASELHPVPGDRLRFHLGYDPRPRTPEDPMGVLDTVSVAYRLAPGSLDAARIARILRGDAAFGAASGDGATTGPFTLRDMKLAAGDSVTLYMDLAPKPRLPDHRLTRAEVLNVDFDLHPERLDAARLARLLRDDAPPVSEGVEGMPLQVGDNLLLYLDYAARPRLPGHALTEAEILQVDFDFHPERLDAARIARLVRGAGDASSAIGDARSGAASSSPPDDATDEARPGLAGAILAAKAADEPGVASAPTTPTLASGPLDVDRLPLQSGDNLLLYMDYAPKPRLPEHVITPLEELAIDFALYPQRLDAARIARMLRAGSDAPADALATLDVDRMPLDAGDNLLLYMDYAPKPRLPEHRLTALEEVSFDFALYPQRLDAARIARILRAGGDAPGDALDTLDVDRMPLTAGDNLLLYMDYAPKPRLPEHVLTPMEEIAIDFALYPQRLDAARIARILRDGAGDGDDAATSGTASGGPLDVDRMPLRAGDNLLLYMDYAPKPRLPEHVLTPMEEIAIDFALYPQRLDAARIARMLRAGGDVPADSLDALDVDHMPLEAGDNLLLYMDYAPKPRLPEHVLTPMEEIAIDFALYPQRLDAARIARILRAGGDVPADSLDALDVDRMPLQPGDNLLLYMDYAPKPRLPEHVLTPMEEIAIDFALYPQRLDAARIARILRAGGDVPADSLDALDVDRLPLQPGDNLLLYMDYVPETRLPDHELTELESLDIDFDLFPEQIDGARLARLLKSEGDSIPEIASIREMPLEPGDNLLLYLDYIPGPRPPEHRLASIETVKIDYEIVPETIDASRVAPLARGEEPRAGVVPEDELVLRAGDKVLVYLDHVARPRMPDHRVGPVDEVTVDFEFFPTDLDAAGISQILRAAAPTEGSSTDDATTGTTPTTVARGGFRTPPITDIPVHPGDNLLLYMDFIPQPRLPEHRLGLTEQVSVQFEFNPKYDFEALPAEDGMISAPLVGRVPALGKTAAELLADLQPLYEKLLGQEFLRVDLLPAENLYQKILQQMQGSMIEPGAAGTRGVFSVPVRSDGRIFLPSVGFHAVEGRTVSEIEGAIRDAYGAAGFGDFVITASFSDRSHVKLAPSTFSSFASSPGEDGTIPMPLLGRVPVLGRTAEELRADLLRRYDEIVGPVRLQVAVRGAKPLYDSIFDQLQGQTLEPGERAARGVYSLTVRPDGRIHMPAIDFVEVAGRTVADFEADVQRRYLDAGYVDLRVGANYSLRSPWRLGSELFADLAARPAEDGMIEVPLLGRVPVVGMTAAQVKADLERRYADLVGAVRLRVDFAGTEDFYRSILQQLRGGTIEPGDKASTGVYSLAVRPDGRIYLPGLEYVEVGGKKIVEVEADIRKRYHDEGLIDLRVDAAFSERSRLALGSAVFKGFLETAAPDGTIHAPLVGRVPALGRTANAIRSELEARYADLVGPVRMSVSIASAPDRYQAVLRQIRGGTIEPGDVGAAAATGGVFSLTVRPDGGISLPGIEGITVSGKSPVEIQSILREAYIAKGYTDFEIVTAFSERSQTVLGDSVFKGFEGNTAEDGSIRVPLLGRVQVVGRTAEDIRAELEARYADLVGPVRLTATIRPLADRYQTVLQQLRGSGIDPGVEGGTNGVFALTVRPDGRIVLPALGGMDVSGKSPAQIQSILRDAFVAKGYTDFEIVTAFSERSQTVLGDSVFKGFQGNTAEDGSIRVPLLGRVQVVGRTAEDIRAELEARYADLVGPVRLTATIRPLADRYQTVLQQLRGSGIDPGVEGGTNGVFALTVRPDGRIVLPALGGMDVSGKTPAQIQSILRDAFVAKGYTDFEIVTAFSERSQTVLGDSVFKGFQGNTAEDGSIRVPLLGRVQVVGRTAEDIRAELEARYADLVGPVRLTATIRPLADRYQTVLQQLRGSGIDPGVEGGMNGVFALNVRPDGRIVLPALGGMDVSGRSPVEIQSLLRDAFVAKGYTDFEIVTAFSERSQTVLGNSVFQGFTGRTAEDGSIRVPLLGRVDVVGRTAEDIRADLEARYADLVGPVRLTATIRPLAERYQTVLQQLRGSGVDPGVEGGTNGVFALTVRPDGRIVLPALGGMDVSGRSPVEIQSLLQSAFASKGYTDFDIVTAFSERSQTVLGDAVFKGFTGRTAEDGSIRVPLLGRVMVLDRTAEEIRAELEARYSDLVGPVRMTATIRPLAERYQTVLQQLRGSGVDPGVEGGTNGVFALTVRPDGRIVLPVLEGIGVRGRSPIEIQSLLRDAFAAKGYTDFDIVTAFSERSQTVLGDSVFRGFEGRTAEDGSIRVPLLGRVEVVGRTAEAVRAELEARYADLVGPVRLTATVRPLAERYQTVLQQLRGAMIEPGDSGGVNGVFSLSVRPDGRIVMPVLEGVSVAGRTPLEVQTLLRERFVEEGYTDFEIATSFSERSATSLGSAVFKGFQSPPASDGSITAPLIGRVHVLGRDTDDIRAEMERRYAEAVGPVRLSVGIVPDEEKYKSIVAQLTGATIEPGDRGARGVFSLAVRPDGGIFIPGAGRVDVAGRTAESTADEIRARFAAAGLVDFEVSAAFSERSQIELGSQVFKGFNAVAAEDGTIRAPLLGRVPVLGRTLKEIDEELETRYEALVGPVRIEVRAEPSDTRYRSIFQQLSHTDDAAPPGAEGVFVAMVRPDGRIFAPGLDFLPVEGMTVAELERALSDGYRAAGLIDLDIRANFSARAPLSLSEDVFEGFTNRAAPDGTVNVPLIGRVKVLGRLAAEVRDEIVARYRPLVGEIDVQVEFRSAESSYTLLFGRFGLQGVGGVYPAEVRTGGDYFFPSAGFLPARGLTVGEIETAARRLLAEQGYTDLDLRVDLERLSRIEIPRSEISQPREINGDGTISLPMGVRVKAAGSRAVEIVEAIRTAYGAYVPGEMLIQVRVEQQFQKRYGDLQRALEKEEFRTVVGPDGAVRLPGIPAIPLAGRGLAEASEAIDAAYAAAGFERVAVTLAPLDRNWLVAP